MYYHLSHNMEKYHEYVTIWWIWPASKHSVWILSYCK